MRSSSPQDHGRLQGHIWTGECHNAKQRWGVMSTGTGAQKKTKKTTYIIESVQQGHTRYTSLKSRSSSSELETTRLRARNPDSRTVRKNEGTNKLARTTGWCLYMSHITSHHCCSPSLMGDTTTLQLGENTKKKDNREVSHTRRRQRRVGRVGCGYGCQLAVGLGRLSLPPHVINIPGVSHK